MAASLVPVSFGPSMIFTKDESTAGERTWLFFLTNTADGTPATGKTISGADFKISKNGAAFGNAAGTVTEMSLGWYKMVFAAADLDTAGTLACELSVEAGVDPIHVAHQVVAFDLTTSTVAVASIAANAVTASALASDAVTEIQSGLATDDDVAAVTHKVRNTTHSLGTITGASGNSSGVSMKDATKAVVTVTGTFGGGTATLQTCADPQATSPVWVATASTLTSDGSVTVTGPVRAIRVALSGATGATVVCTAEVSRPV